MGGGIAAAMVLATWTAFAFAGAGLLSRPPLLRTGPIPIGSVYVLRGILIGPQLMGGWLGTAAPFQDGSWRCPWSLSPRACYLAGRKLAWRA